MKRNGYIDIIKFFFAIMVAEFHLGSGIFPGGRLAVEGFFIITGYLMMKSIEKDRAPQESLGVSTAKFIWRKYKSLFWYLLPSALLGFTVVCMRREFGISECLEKLPLLFSEIIPLRSTGIPGMHVLGISWYLSSMFIGLSVLYPLCRKYKQGVTLIICPLIVLIGYGSLAHFFGHLALNHQYIPETILNTGVVRGLAGLSLGCLLYEASALVSQKTPSFWGRTLFTFIEGLTFCLFIYIVQNHPKDEYNFIAVFLLFAFLYIGINGLSWLSYLWNAKLTKPLGTASLLIVITHFYWVAYFKKMFGNGFGKSADNYWYAIAVIASCIVVYAIGELLKRFFSKSEFKFFKTTENKQ